MAGASSSLGAMNQSFTSLLGTPSINEQWQQFLMLQHFNAFQATGGPIQRPVGETSSQPARTNVASAEEDEVQEVPAPPKRVTKKGVAAAEKAKWSMDECVLLCRAWTHASHDSKVGISQDETMFWRKVIEWYNQDPPAGERNKSQLQGKWNKIKSTTKKFGAIRKRLQEHGRQSGADDKQVYNQAHIEYVGVHGPPRYQFEPCYEVLKDCPAFWQDHSIPRKGVGEYVDLGDFVELGQSSQNSDATTERLFGDDPIRRPMGRNVARKMSSGSDATSSRGGSSGSEQALHTLDRMLMLQEEQVRKIDEDMRKVEEERQVRADERFRKKVRAAFALLQQPIPTSIDEDELEQIRATRKNLFEKYGPYFKDI
uniref:uncharacterized protein LOC122591929 n=1 Tax=Erigeron canadensis TaxID=72917 RepID=UPI001CB8B17F|nr:uncharacterized protein LOC122591929 [Erigeron canadensis]